MVDEVDALNDIRRRPGMYIGGTTPIALVHLAMEITANSFDQVLAGAADHIEVTVGPAGAITVSDNGSGISVEEGDDGRSFLERVFTELHDAPTADGHRPHVHLGLGGQGVFPVCALSELVEVETCDGAVTYRQSFARGRVSTPLAVVPRSDQRPGTTVRFRPDPEIFGTQSIPVGRLEDELSTLAALVPGVTVNLSVDQTYGPWTDVRHLHEATWPHGADAGPFLIEHAAPAGRASMALSFSKRVRQPDLVSRSFCNYFETKEGGTHVAGIEEGLRRVFGPSTAHALQRTRVVLHVTLDDPQFVGPTRGKLDSPEAIALVADALAMHLPAILSEQPGLDADLRPSDNAATD